MTLAFKGRRTALSRADGSPVPDDWVLADERGQPVGRIYLMTGGPERRAMVLERLNRPTRATVERRNRILPDWPRG